jgi:2,4-dienoyl-CoA reductase-like NADH-dependent reductase (Old Yellow Enzyme family)
MSRYYKYKKAEDLIQDAQQLGHSISLSDDFSPLFQSISIGHKTAGNRMAIQPMEGCDGTIEGIPDELTYRRYERFGAGGAKLIWGEATAITPEGRMNPRQLMINDHTASSLEKMYEEARVHHRKEFSTDSDLIIGIQLTHSGRYSFQKPLIATHDPITDPLTINKSTGKCLDDSYPVLTDDELKQIEDQYVQAAILSAKIGLDFIDLKQCHRYLLSELLAAKNRPGPYGGSLENRTRLIRNIVTRIKEEVPDLIIGTRMNVYDGVPYRSSEKKSAGEPRPHVLPIQVAFGTNPDDHLIEEMEEPIRLAKNLVDWGVKLMNISMGNPYANPHLIRPAEYAPVDGYLPPEHPLLGVLRHFRLAHKIQESIPEIPVVGSGYSWLQDWAMHAASANVSEKNIAIVGLGRATLSQPDFVKNLLKNGELERKKVCRTFSYCTNLMRSKDHPLGQYPTGCPPFDKEVYDPIWKEAKEKLDKDKKP